MHQSRPELEETPLKEPATPEQTTPSLNTEQPVDEQEEPQESDTEQAADESDVVEELTQPALSTSVPDPYFYVNGDKHSFLPDGGDCTGAANCMVSTTPITDALNAVAGGLTPDDGIIYVEGGTYEEDLDIQGFNDLTLQGSVNDSASVLAGSVTIQNSSNFNVYNFVFKEVVRIANSEDVGITGTDSNDEIEVTLEGDVENLSVDGAAGDDTITINQDAESSSVIVDGGEGEDDLTVNAPDSDDQITQDAAQVTINDVQIVIVTDIESTLVQGGEGADQIAVSGDIIMNGNHPMEFDLNGVAQTQYDRLSVSGTIDLNNATLQLNLGYKPSTGDTFLIIDNADGPALGEFANLSEGAEFYVDGTKFSITYVGGLDGYDVVLVDALDFGDAPSPYPTTLAEDGARHDTSAGPTLGANRDSEADGAHSANADADDTTGTPDDEDGVTIGTIKVGEVGATVY